MQLVGYYFQKILSGPVISRLAMLLLPCGAPLIMFLPTCSNCNGWLVFIMHGLVLIHFASTFLNTAFLRVERLDRTTLLLLEKCSFPVPLACRLPAPAAKDRLCHAHCTFVHRVPLCSDIFAPADLPNTCVFLNHRVDRLCRCPCAQ